MNRNSATDRFTCALCKSCAQHAFGSAFCKPATFDAPPRVSLLNAGDKARTIRERKRMLGPHAKHGGLFCRDAAVAPKLVRGVQGYLSGDFQDGREGDNVV